MPHPSAVATFPRVNFVVGGDGAKGAEFAGMLEEHGALLKNRVVWLGSINLRGETKGSKLRQNGGQMG